MRVTELDLRGAFLIELEVRRDDRGFFAETFHAEKFLEKGLASQFVQDNLSRSVRGTIRGLHAQLNHPQGKLIRVLSGEIYDVVVDARPDSPSFGKFLGIPLASTDFKQVFVPPGFLHGFCVTSAEAEVEYKCTDFYHPEDEVGVLWNDPRLKIQWPVSSPLLSAKDGAFPVFQDVEKKFEAYRKNKK